MLLRSLVPCVQCGSGPGLTDVLWAGELLPLSLTPVFQLPTGLLGVFVQKKIYKEGTDENEELISTLLAEQTQGSAKELGPLAGRGFGGLSVEQGTTQLTDMRFGSRTTYTPSLVTAVLEYRIPHVVG
ncbi:unnamed protein product [Arctogadus glacialis]